MKSKLLFLGLFLAVLIFASPPAAKAAVNLLANPSFEIDDDGNGEPDGGWWLWGSNWSWDGDSTQEWTTDPALAYDGNVAVHLRAGNEGDDYAMCGPANVAATPGEVYIFAAFAKDLLPGGIASGDPWVKIEYYAGGVMSSDEAYTIPITHDGEYHMIYTEIECPAGIDEILPMIMSGDNSDYMWDSVWFGYGMPAGEGQATQPVPPDGGQALPTLEELSWTNPEAASPAEPISCDVWFLSLIHI